jgi:hypothetical protein
MYKSMLIRCDRYYVPGATGKEVAIFDLHAGTCTLLFLPWFLELITVIAASNIVAKDIFAVTEDSAPVTVMCDPKAVSFSCLSFWT